MTQRLEICSRYVGSSSIVRTKALVWWEELKKKMAKNLFVVMTFRSLQNDPHETSRAAPEKSSYLADTSLFIFVCFALISLGRSSPHS